VTDRKSGPCGFKLTSPASYSLLPLVSCQSQVVVAGPLRLMLTESTQPAQKVNVAPICRIRGNSTALGRR